MTALTTAERLRLRDVARMLLDDEKHHRECAAVPGNKRRCLRDARWCRLRAEACLKAAAMPTPRSAP